MDKMEYQEREGESEYNKGKTGFTAPLGSFLYPPAAWPCMSASRPQTRRVLPDLHVGIGIALRDQGRYWKLSRLDPISLSGLVPSQWELPKMAISLGH